MAGRKALGVFDHDDEAKVFLERELGLTKAVPLLGREVPVWRWSFRFVKPLEKGELRAFVSPAGELLSFRRILPEKAAAADAGPERARAMAEETLRTHRGLDPAALRFVEATEEKRPARVDRTFVWESKALRWNGAAIRYLVEVQGDQVGRSSLWLDVPEAWRQAYATLRSKNRAAGAVATFGLVLTALALVVVFFDRLRRRDVKWHWALAFAMTGTVLQMAASLNELPITLFSYETTESWASFLTQALLSDFGAACLLGLLLLLLVAGGEPEYREAYPEKPALGRVFSRRAFGTKRVFLGLLAGYALTAGFFAYQVLFYLAADRLGAWSPADVPYSNLLGTSLPWLGVLLMGFVPATTEEFSSRMFSIPFLRRFAPAWVAVGVPALIWGFAHSTYPNQPFWIRGVEVGLAGVVIGVVMLKLDLFPLLVWHFTVDAVYTSLILVRSTNTYFAVSGALAAGVLLLPLVVAGVLALKRGGFEAESGLTNAEVGSAPPPWPGASSEAPAIVAPKPLSVNHVAAAAVVSVVVLLLVRAVLPRGGLDADVRVSRTDAIAAAQAFVKTQGDDPARYLAVAESGSALPSLEDAGETGAGLIPYGWERNAERWLLAHGGMPVLRTWATTVLPGPVWQVRFARERDRHRWWVVVDARDGRVTGFSRGLPEEEAGASLSPAEALETARAAARGRGIDPAALVVVSSNAEERKGRRDHRIVFEVPSQAAGEARRRVTVSVAGATPSLVATALKLPEEWARAQGRSTTATYAALALKVAGFGTVLGLGLVALLRAHRAGRMRWREAARWAVLLTLPALFERVSNLPTLLRTWPADMPLTVYAVTAAIGVAAGLLLLLRARARGGGARDGGRAARPRPPEASAAGRKEPRAPGRGGDGASRLRGARPESEPGRGVPVGGGDGGLRLPARDRRLASGGLGPGFGDRAGSPGRGRSGPRRAPLPRARPDASRAGRPRTRRSRVLGAARRADLRRDRGAARLRRSAGGGAGPGRGALPEGRPVGLRLHGGRGHRPARRRDARDLGSDAVDRERGRLPRRRPPRPPRSGLEDGGLDYSPDARPRGVTRRHSASVRRSAAERPMARCMSTRRRAASSS